jgi:hypothetical protein
VPVSPIRLAGTCRFAPPLDPRGGRVRRDGGSTEHWLILACDPELGRYLRHLYLLDARRTRSLSDPLWGPHVSVIQGEVPPRPALWKDREGAALMFTLRHPPQEIGDYVFFPVDCEAALEYREALGLPREPRHPLHLTIGNRKRPSR